MRRAQILEAALPKFSEIGVKMDDIAVASGMSKRGIAYYFNFNETLIILAFQEFFTIFRAAGM